MEALISLFALLFCVVVPIALVVALIRWLIHRGAPATPSPAATLAELERLVARWQQAGQLSDEAAAHLRELLAFEQVALAQPVPGFASAPLTAAVPAPAPGEASVAQPIAAAAPQPAGQSLGDRFGHALLALRTRQTLLFLGAFLLVMSALILIVFNWASFSPILQFMLIAGVCAGFWAGGAWLIRNTDLDRAGAGLQVVGGLLVPVVAFSLSRPGLLELAPRTGVLLAALICLPIYALAAWRLRRALFAGAACVSLACAVLAALSPIANQWLPLALVLVLAPLLVLARWLARRAPNLAAAPVWVAHVGVALALLSVLAGQAASLVALASLAAVLWAGAGFYLLAAWLEHRHAWAWAGAALPLLALLATLAALDAAAPWWGLTPAMLGLTYLGLALALEDRLMGWVRPAAYGAGVLLLLALAPALAGFTTARWALPPLGLGLLIVTLADRRGRLAWLAEPNRRLAAGLGLAGAAALLAAWVWALLALVPLPPGARGLLLMPLAGLYLLGAASWPGRLRRSYDLALQLVGLGLALAAGALTLSAPSYWLPALATLSLLWLFQALRHQQWPWALLTLGTALFAAAVWLARLSPAATTAQWALLLLACAALYLLGGAVLRGGSRRYWSGPALGWGTLAGLLALLIVLVDLLDAGPPLGWHVLAIVALAGTIAVAGAIGRAAWPGFAVAGLLAFAIVLAGARGFFSGWQPADADFGYIVCTITLAFVLLGQVLRRVDARYAYPYELIGFALLTCAPLPAAGAAQPATLVWAAMLLLYTLAARLYRLRWATALALLALDMALLNGSAWLLPGGRPAGAGLTLLAAAWLQALLGRWPGRSAAAGGRLDRLGLRPADLVALISAAGALAIASRADDVLAIVGFGLAGLLALLASAYRKQSGAWAALALLALGFAALHRVLVIEPLWSMAWGVAEALGVCLAGWAIALGANSRAASGEDSAFSTWARPLWLGPLVAGGLLVAALLAAAPVAGNLPPLTFGLATLALLLATLAVRRASVYAYAAAGALVLAGLCQLYDWGFRQPQWFVLPAGVYLLALAEGLRRIQRQRQLAQLIETGGLVLLLGVSFGQSLRAEGLASQAYAGWVCAEALLVLGYGVLRRLRAPFIGGAAFFVAGVLWLSADPLLALNKWVLLGLLGLLLVGVYVLLERRQQELVRAGRALIETVGSWG